MLNFGVQIAERIQLILFYAESFVMGLNVLGFQTFFNVLVTKEAL